MWTQHHRDPSCKDPNKTRKILEAPKLLPPRLQPDFNATWGFPKIRGATADPPIYYDPHVWGSQKGNPPTFGNHLPSMCSCKLYSDCLKDAALAEFVQAAGTFPDWLLSHVWSSSSAASYPFPPLCPSPSPFVFAPPPLPGLLLRNLS